MSVAHEPDDVSVDRDLVVTHAGAVFHAPGCCQVAGRDLTTYEPGMRRTLSDGSRVSYRPCATCRPTVRDRPAAAPQGVQSGQGRRVAQAPAWIYGTVMVWKQRDGPRVPGPECLPPAERVSARQFAAWMRRMLGDPNDQKC